MSYQKASLFFSKTMTESTFSPKHKLLIFCASIILVWLLAFLIGLTKEYCGWLLPGCNFYEVTGWLCPGCGGTRAAVALAKMDLASAWRSNQLIFLLPLFFLLLIWKPTWFATRKTAIAALVITLVYWLLRNFPCWPQEWMPHF